MSSTPSAPGTFVAHLAPTAADSLNVGTLTQRPPSDTPGNVAVCLGGGGARARTSSTNPVRTWRRRPRQWALADIAGASSAAFAQAVHGALVDLATNPPRFAAALVLHGEDAVRLVARSGGDAPSARAFVARRMTAARAGAAWYYRHNQIFPSDELAAVRDGLWAASGGGSYQTAPIFAQPLTTVANPWFGVAAGTNVTVLWVYLEHAADWHDRLGFSEKLEVDAQTVIAGFPHYDTLNTELTPTQINLLANLVAWSVVNPNNVEKFASLFAPDVTPPA